MALATYNGSRYLQDQLESIAAQSLAPCEIVLCDDRSGDATLDIARAFARSAPFPVHLVDNEVRLNFRANFMKAAQRCSGDLIAFCDQDDLWRADKLSLAAAAFADPEVLLVHHNARVFSAAAGVMGCLIDEHKPSQVYPPLVRTPFEMSPGFTQVFRRSLLQLSDLREATVDYWGHHEAVAKATGAHEPLACEPMAHDQWIFVLASALGKVSYLSDALADYRQHDANLYGMTIRHATRWQRLLRHVKEYSDYGHLQLAFAGIAQVFRQAAGRPLEEGLARRAGEAAAVYEAMAQAYAERKIAYGATSPSARLGAWLGLIRQGRYRPGKGFYFAHQGLVRDFIHGVCRATLRHTPKGLSANDASLRLTGRSRQLNAHPQRP